MQDESAIHTGNASLLMSGGLSDSADDIDWPILLSVRFNELKHHEAVSERLYFQVENVVNSSISHNQLR